MAKELVARQPEYQNNVQVVFITPFSPAQRRFLKNYIKFSPQELRKRYWIDKAVGVSTSDWCRLTD